jgi:hypothetical protein
MACFLVTHRVGSAFSSESWLADEKRVIGHLPREIKWVMSWYLPDKQLMLAHWDAPSEQAVRVALERSGIAAALPILKIETAVELYPKRYVARRSAAHAHKERVAQKKQARKRKAFTHATREMSGAYAEAISSILQVRAAAHLHAPRPSSN